MDFITIFGTIASVVIAISLTMKNIKLLRVVNFIGAVLFSIYGFFIGAMPVIIINIIIAVIDIYFYIPLVYNREQFDFVLNDNAKTHYAELFIKHYLEDIKKFFPGFNIESLEGLKSAYILRNMVPALIMLYKDTDGDFIDIVLDYATPQFRDQKSSSYFFKYAANHLNIDKSKKKYFKVHSGIKVHDKYLKKMGFDRIGETKEFRKAI